MYMNSGNGLGRPVFTKQGTQGQKWIQASITLSPKVPFQVRKRLKMCITHPFEREKRERDGLTDRQTDRFTYLTMMISF